MIAGTRLHLTATEGDELLTIAIDVGTGRALWRRALRRERKMEMYKANDPASPTPAADEGGVISFVADFGLIAYDTDGRVLWSRQMGPFQNFYGPTCWLFRPVARLWKSWRSCWLSSKVELPSASMTEIDMPEGRP